MATRSAQKPTSVALNAAYLLADAAGERVTPGVLVHVKNAGAVSTDLTLVTPKVLDTDLAVADRVNTIPVGGERFVRVPNNAAYLAADGLVDLTWTATASVTFAVLE